MRGLKKVAGIAAMAVMLMCNVALAAESGTASEEIVPKVNDGTKIVINLASRGLYLYEQGVKTRLYPIACGKPSDPTPVGYYTVIEKEVNPIWRDSRSGEVVYSGPDNPLGYRWISFRPYYGIHGTNNPDSIGSFASRGCIRMHEQDVEELYERVEVGTPVEIFYNRVVVEKAPDGTVTYYIYPDTYERQPITVAQVNEWLHGFGVECFESDEAIAAKIEAEDGQPTYVAKPYSIQLNGQMMAFKAVEKNGECYLPAMAMAEALNMPIFYDRDNEVVVTSYSTAPVSVFKDVLYINAAYAGKLLHLGGGTADKAGLIYYTMK